MSKVQTQVQSHFADAVHADVSRSVFLRNSTKKTTFNAGVLVPVYVDEVLPGDTFEMDMAFVSRLTTPIFPTMDVLNLDFLAFFVPNRIVWDGWEALNGQNDSGPWVPTVAPALVPVFDGTGTIPVTSKCLGDYYGLPVGMSLNDFPVSALILRGYGSIWNEWFRDQNLQAPAIINKGNVESSSVIYHPLASLKSVNKKHDYFTSCLPAPQKGESALIPIELNDLIPVVTGNNNTSLYGVSAPLMMRTNNATESGANVLYMNGGAGNNKQVYANKVPTTGISIESTYPVNLWADGRGLSLNATTISELRTAFQIQKLFERDARGGTRYIEMLKAHFGVDAQDYRLQRPEFLGRMQSYVGIQQVAQTSSTDSTSPQGNLAAFSYTSNNGTFFKKSFVEHGFIHIFAVARQPKTYQQGLEKMWSRRERLDFYMPVLAHISEQPVYNKEIYALSTKADGDKVFGYNEAWADYRFKPNQVTGQFRSGVANSLDNWHYSDYYTSRPTLSNTWIQDNSRTNVDRTIAVQSTLHDQIIIDIAFKCKATRPMPVNSVPGLVDHF